MASDLTAGVRCGNAAHPKDIEALRPYAHRVLREVAIPELLNDDSGKLRENHDPPDGSRILIATDRLSAFYRIVCAIPFKGQMLTQTADICPNHMISYPDPNVVIAKRL